MMVPSSYPLVPVTPIPTPANVAYTPTPMLAAHPSMLYHQQMAAAVAAVVGKANDTKKSAVDEEEEAERKKNMVPQ